MNQKTWGMKEWSFPPGKHPLETDNFGSSGSSTYFLFCEIPIPPGVCKKMIIKSPFFEVPNRPKRTVARFVCIGAAETVLSGTGRGIQSHRWRGLVGTDTSLQLHPWKLTWHWKIRMFNRKYIFIHGGFSTVMLVFLGCNGTGRFPWVERPPRNFENSRNWQLKMGGCNWKFGDAPTPYFSSGCIPVSGIFDSAAKDMFECCTPLVLVQSVRGVDRQT